MRKLLVSAIATAALVAAVSTAFAATKTVKVGDNWFVRNTTSVPTVTVSKNTTVVWRFVGRSSHNVHAIKGPVKFTLPKSGAKVSGTVRRKMTRKGTYTLICDIHGRADQSMKLVVK